MRLKIDPSPPVGDSGRLVCNLSPATCRIVLSSRPIGNQTRSRRNYPAGAAKEHKHSDVVVFLSVFVYFCSEITFPLGRGMRARESNSFK